MQVASGASFEESDESDPFGIEVDPEACAVECDEGEKLFEVQLNTDEKPSQTFWSLQNICTGKLEATVRPRSKYQDGLTSYRDLFCVPDAR